MSENEKEALFLDTRDFPSPYSYDSKGMAAKLLKQKDCI